MGKGDRQLESFPAMNSPFHGSFPIPEYDAAREAIEAPQAEWPPINVPKRIEIEIRQLSPEIQAELAAVRNRMSSLQHND